MASKGRWGRGGGSSGCKQASVCGIVWSSGSKGKKRMRGGGQDLVLDVISRSVIHARKREVRLLQRLPHDRLVFHDLSPAAPRTDVSTNQPPGRPGPGPGPHPSRCTPCASARCPFPSRIPRKESQASLEMCMLATHHDSARARHACNPQQRFRGCKQVRDRVLGD